MEPGTYIVDHPTDTPVLADVPRDATATVRWARYVPSGWAGMHAALHLDVRFSDGRRVLQSVPLPPGAWLQAPNGAEVRRGAVLATLYRAGSAERRGLPELIDLLEVAHPSPRAIVAERDGVVRFVPSPPHPTYRALLRIDPDDGTRPVYRRVRKGSDVGRLPRGLALVVGELLARRVRRPRDGGGLRAECLDGRRGAGASARRAPGGAAAGAEGEGETEEGRSEGAHGFVVNAHHPSTLP